MISCNFRVVGGWWSQPKSESFIFGFGLTASQALLQIRLVIKFYFLFRVLLENVNGSDVRVVPRDWTLRPRWSMSLVSAVASRPGCTATSQSRIWRVRVIYRIHWFENNNFTNEFYVWRVWDTFLFINWHLKVLYSLFNIVGYEKCHKDWIKWLKHTARWQDFIGNWQLARRHMTRWQLARYPITRCNIAVGKMASGIRCRLVRLQMANCVFYHI